MVSTLTADPMTEAQRRQAEARQRYRESLATQDPLSGTKLGAEFGLGERWGQKRIEEVHAEAKARATSPMLPTVDEGGSLPPFTPPNSEPELAEKLSRFTQWKARLADRKANRRSARAMAPAPRQAPAEAPTAPQRRGASGVAWLAFGLGIIISVSANVGHIWFVSKPSAEAMWSAMVFAAFWPVALAVAVEVLSRVSWPAGLRWPGLLGTMLVGGVALVVSYRHMNGLLIYFGESWLSAALGPIGVDGLLIVGGFALLAIGETKKRIR